MIKKVNESYKKNLLGIILGPTLKIIEAIFDLLIPLFMKAILDLKQYENPDDIPQVISKGLAHFIRIFSDSSFINDALVGGAIILIMGVVGFAITMVCQFIAAKTSVAIGTEIRSSLYNKYLTMGKKERDKIGSGRLLTILNSDTYQHQNGVLLFVRLIVRAPFILIGSLIVSFILDWRVGLAFTAIVPLIILVNAIVLRKSSKDYVEIQKNLDDISSYTSETVEGARVIKASNNEEYQINQFKGKSTSYQNKAIKVNIINSLINPLTFAITSLVLVVIILLLQGDLFSGSVGNNGLISSTIIAEMAYLAQIFFVTVQLTQAIIDIVKARVSRKRIDAILSIEPSIIDGEYTEDKEVNFRDEIIHFSHVSFSYSEDLDKCSLSDIDFLIKKGETFGIIGGTGSGKSTIVNLLMRFYEPQVGNISFKGIDVKDYALATLRKNVGLVNQKSSLFTGTIKSNYLMSNPLASDEDIINALKNAEAYEFVSKYDEGINHQVDEGGSNFSGGQRQRLCIGRALVRNPEILILDDSTSALDLLTDKRIRERLANMKEMTKIIISQRISTIQDADYILVIDQGKMVGKGKHEDLLKSCSLYKEIYETQIKKE